MKIKINTSKMLVNLLFLLIALLVSAIGLKLNLGDTVARGVFQIGALAGLLSFLLLAFGMFTPFVLKSKKGNPSKIRQKLTQSFNFAEANSNKFLRRIQIKNALFFTYYLIVCLIGVIFFIGVSFCFFIKPITIVSLPLIFVATVPVRKTLEYFLKKDSLNFNDDGIKKEEFESTFSTFEKVVKKELGSGYRLNLGFGSIHSLNASKVAKTIQINVNSYAFMLFNKKELEALTEREILALKDRKCKKIVEILQSRKLYLAISSSNKVFGGYFSFIIGDTVSNFDFAKNALKRILERRKDELLVGTEYSIYYLTAFTKQGVIDSFFGDARSFITLKLSQDECLIRRFVQSVYNIFLDLFPIYGREWESLVKNKLKAVVCDKLTYKEKLDILQLDNVSFEIADNSTDEQKELYEKYNVEYYESTKLAHEPKFRAIEEYYRKIERYEQRLEEYDERLKLIGVAHAYYMTAQLDKAEEIYNAILNSGDSSSETYFDYGCFLLLAKKDVKGVDYLYKAMENENLVEEGLEVLGKHFITSGDEKSYQEFCDYKSKKLDEIINGYDGKMLDRNAVFTNTTLENSVLEEIVQKLAKDDNLEEIYCVDSKTKAGDKITVFAVAVRNKTQESFIETYERVFSILDNDYGKYDTFLISIDAEPDKKLVNRLKSDKNFLIFKR